MLWHLPFLHNLCICVCTPRVCEGPGEVREGKGRSHWTGLLQMSHGEGKHGNVQPFLEKRDDPEDDVGALGKMGPPLPTPRRRCLTSWP